MATLYELNEAAWHAWLAERPDIVRGVAERLPPNRLYRLTTTGQRVTIESYSESGTVTVAVRGEYNLTDFEREVFGVSPDHLVECELPSPDEKIGALITDPQELKSYHDVLRPIILAQRTANPNDPYGKKKH